MFRALNRPLGALILLMSAASPLPAQMKDHGPPVTSGGTALDILMDLAASAPARQQAAERGSRGDKATDAPAKDSRERLLEQLKSGTASPTDAADAPVPMIPAMDPAAVLSGTQRGSPQPAESEGELIKHRIEVEAAAKKPVEVRNDRLHIAQDSWIRTVAYWIRDNRNWLSVVIVILLALAWIVSSIFARGGGGRRASGAMAGSAAPPPPPARPTATRPVRRRPQTRRSR